MKNYSGQQITVRSLLQPVKTENRYPHLSFSVLCPDPFQKSRLEHGVRVLSFL